MNDDLRALEGHVILTEADGVLRGMTADAVNEIVDAAAASERVVLHFHGGLVPEKRGRAVAVSLLSVYREAGAYPVLFVWRSGLFEILRGNLGKIAGEDAFKTLTKLVLKFVIGKVLGAEGAKGGIQLPEEREVATELARRQREEEPYAEFTVE